MTLHLVLHFLPIANIGLALSLLRLLQPGKCLAIQLDGDQLHFHMIWDIFVIKYMLHLVQAVDETLSLQITQKFQ